MDRCGSTLLSSSVSARRCSQILAMPGAFLEYLESPNIYLYTAMITDYASSLSYQRDVVALYREMTAMISGYMRLGQIGSAILLFEEMPERDVPSWNSIISGCTQNGLFSEAISLIKWKVIAEELGESNFKKSRPNQTSACAL
ncbi:hypothetical protein QQ045_023651 [Rhodiola kirilowii]